VAVEECRELRPAVDGDRQHDSVAMASTNALFMVVYNQFITIHNKDVLSRRVISLVK
jgi:hypothetical protein